MITGLPWWYSGKETHRIDGYNSKCCFCYDLCVCVCVCSVAQPRPTLCDPMDCSPPGSSVHRVFQARILEQVAISYSAESSQFRNRAHVFCVFCIGRQIFTTMPPGKPLLESNENLRAIRECKSARPTQCSVDAHP